MDYKRNWILVEASTSEATTPIHIRDTKRMTGPSIPLQDEANLQRSNKMNDEIHRTIIDAYQNGHHEYTVHEGTRVIDESFRFIDDEDTRMKTINDTFTDRNPFDHINSLVSHRNGQGENRGKSDRRYRRTDSLDSASLRKRRHYISSTSPRWRVPSTSTDNLAKYYGKRPATLLRRTPQFYDKCDLCAFKIFRPSDFCSACNRGASPMHSLNILPCNRPSAYYLDQILSSRGLETNVSKRPPEWNEIGRIYSTATPFHQFPSLASIRSIKSPVYRYVFSKNDAEDPRQNHNPQQSQFN
uniref:ARF7EP_C domain-containing protein n=1 Tax=Heterorhabditis bacteriophora TaxID=37862 RepID=A0A1I7X635_HETBA